MNVMALAGPHALIVISPFSHCVVIIVLSPIRGMGRFQLRPLAIAYVWNPRSSPSYLSHHHSSGCRGGSDDTQSCYTLSVWRFCFGGDLTITTNRPSHRLEMKPWNITALDGVMESTSEQQSTTADGT